MIYTVPQVIILGPPASGKRSIAKMVCAKTRAAHLTMENLVAEAEVDVKEEAESFIRKKEVSSLILICRSEKNGSSSTAHCQKYEQGRFCFQKFD